jgi:hypothetical protein
MKPIRKKAEQRTKLGRNWLRIFVAKSKSRAMKCLPTS